MVDRTNHHLFQPLLYQVAAGGLSEGDCASAIRGHLRRQPNASVLMAEVTDVDVERRRVILDRAEPLGYDSLVVACGAETSYFGNDEWEDVVRAEDPSRRRRAARPHRLRLRGGRAGHRSGPGTNG